MTQVNQLLEARKQMAKMMKMMGSGKMPPAPGGRHGRQAAAERDTQGLQQTEEESEKVIRWQ